MYNFHNSVRNVIMVYLCRNLSCMSNCSYPKASALQTINKLKKKAILKLISPFQKTTLRVFIKCFRMSKMQNLVIILSHLISYLFSPQSTIFNIIVL